MTPRLYTPIDVARMAVYDVLDDQDDETRCRRCCGDAMKRSRCDVSHQKSLFWEISYLSSKFGLKSTCSAWGQISFESCILLRRSSRTRYMLFDTTSQTRHSQSPSSNIGHKHDRSPSTAAKQLGRLRMSSLVTRTRLSRRPSLPH